MIVTKTKIRVRYAETDRAGYVYYGNYAQYYEVGRTEMLRQYDFSYKGMEDRGIIMPVLNMHTKYIKPAKYDDLLTITTRLENLPETRMEFFYEIHNQYNELVNIGSTTLAFISARSYKPCRAPEWFLDILRKHM